MHGEIAKFTGVLHICMVIKGIDLTFKVKKLWI